MAFDGQDFGIERSSPAREHADHLRDRKKTNQRRNHVDPARYGIVKNEPLRTHNVVEPDGGEPKPDTAGQQALHDRTGIERADHGYTQDRQPKEVRWAESQSPLRQDRSEEYQQEHAKHATHRRSQERQLQRTCTLPFLGHCVAVKRRSDIGRRARDLQQDRADRAARDGGRVSRAQKDQPLCRFQLEGEGYQERHRHRRREPGRRTQNQPSNRAGKQQAEIDRREHIPEVSQKFQFGRPLSSMAVDRSDYVMKIVLQMFSFLTVIC